MSLRNGLLLKFAKANEFMKFIGPSVNRSSIFDMQYNTNIGSKYYNGSFVAYKNLEDSSCNTQEKKVYRSHDIDNLFLCRDYSFNKSFIDCVAFCFHYKLN